MPRRKSPPIPPPAPVDPADIPLTGLESRWISEFLVDENGTRAYLATHPRCKYGTAAVQAHRLLKKPNIQKEIRAGRDAIVKRNQIRQDEVVQELLRVAYSDIFYLFDADDRPLPARRIPLAARRALAAYDVTENTVTTGVGGKRRVVCERKYKIRFHDKLAALDKLCGILGLKTVSIPPIELLLSMLPRDVADGVRALLATPPGTNGTAA